MFCIICLISSAGFCFWFMSLDSLFLILDASWVSVWFGSSISSSLLFCRSASSLVFLSMVFLLWSSRWFWLLSWLFFFWQRSFNEPVGVVDGFTPWVGLSYFLFWRLLVVCSSSGVGLSNWLR